MNFDWDAPDLGIILLVTLILGFVIYIMFDSIQPEPVRQNTIPPNVYVVETLP